MTCRPKPQFFLGTGEYPWGLDELNYAGTGAASWLSIIIVALL